METVMLAAQLTNLRADFDRLLAVLDALPPSFAHGKSLSGRFKRALSPLVHGLADIEAKFVAGQEAETWRTFTALQRQAQQLFEEALEFLGGLAIREMPTVHALAKDAQRFVEDLVAEAGVSWSPVIIVGPWVDHDLPEALAVGDLPDDSLLRLPLPRWDLWYLPLFAHDYGFWIAKRGHIPDLEAFVAARLAPVAALFDVEPAPEERALWLPELHLLADARKRADDLTTFRDCYQERLKLLLWQQQLHLWHWIADALGAALMGPAYAQALLLLALNPTRPWLEGEAAAAQGGSRYLPAPARRMIIVLHILAAIDARLKADAYAKSGPYGVALRQLTDIWEQALDALGELATYRRQQAALQPWCERVDRALDWHFGVAITEAATEWQAAQQTLRASLQEGVLPTPAPKLRALLSAGWGLRVSHAAPDHIAALTAICEHLLRGVTPPLGLRAAPPTVSPPFVLVYNWLSDLTTDLQRLTALFRPARTTEPFRDAGWLSAGDRDAVAGRMFRLLSAQEYGLRKEQSLLRRNPAPETALIQLAGRMWHQAWGALQEEVLDFLGGVLLRQQQLDDSICSIADALLRDYARLTGINWTSRTVPGRHPLFSPATDMVQLRFPDWELWNLPLMAHEFGHVAAPATPAFLEFVTREITATLRSHPQASSWTRQQQERYLSERSAQLHEFFADAFAVYCQGPAFAFDMVLLHLNPAEAYTPRGHHPTHAERFEGLLTILKQMDTAAQQEGYEDPPYAWVANWLKQVWQQGLSACGTQPDELAPYYRSQARRLTGEIYNVLEQFYRLGAQFSPADWKRANDKAVALLSGNVTLHDETPRTLLNIAWACRVRHPERITDIAHHIWNMWRQWEFKQDW